MIILICCIAWSSSMAQSDGYQYQGTTQGIEVYFKESADSPIKELKLSMYFDAKLSTIVAAINDIPAIPDWVYKTSESRLVKRVSNTEFYYYNRLDFPWPLSDRDVVLRSVFTQDPDTRIARSVSTDYNKGLVDLVPDVVRLPEVRIEWIFYPLKDGRIKLEYYLRSDPGGSIPAWVVNLAVDRGPIRSMTAFRELLKQPKYKTQVLPYVID